MNLLRRTGARVENEDLRCVPRYILPPEVPGSIHFPSGRKAYVTVCDISRKGACVVRRGPLDVAANEEVLLDVSDFEADQDLVLATSVRWVNNLSYKTIVGLAFTDGPLLPGSKFDQYLDRALLPPDSLDSGWF